jgi:PAS domain-containing protein
MEGALSDSGNYLFDRLSASAFIDAMVDEVVILDRDGVIVAANTAWDQFCIETVEMSLVAIGARTIWQHAGTLTVPLVLRLQSFRTVSQKLCGQVNRLNVNTPATAPSSKGGSS